MAHIDRNRTNNRFWNLAALCEPCHLAHDVAQHVYSRFAGREWYLDQYFLDLDPGELARAVSEGRAVLLPAWRQVVRRRRLVRPVQRLPRPQLPLPYTPPVLLTVPALTPAELAHRQRLLLQQALAYVHQP